MCGEHYKELKKQRGKKTKHAVLILPKWIFFRISLHTKFPHVTFESIGAYLACHRISFHFSSILNGLEMNIRPSSNHSQFDSLTTSLSRQLEVNSRNTSFPKIYSSLFQRLLPCRNWAASIQVFRILYCMILFIFIRKSYQSFSDRSTLLSQRHHPNLYQLWFWPVFWASRCQHLLFW